MSDSDALGYGRRSYDRDDVNLGALLANIQTTMEHGFRTINARLDHQSNVLKQHDHDLRELQDERLRNQVTAEKATELMKKIQDDARANSDRNLKIVAAMIALAGVLSTITTKIGWP